MALGVTVTLLVVALGVLAYLLASRDAADSQESLPQPIQPSEPPPTPVVDDLTDLFAMVDDGVVRLEARGCDWEATGSGALVAPDLVLTAAHVVDDAETVQAVAGGTTAAGDVVASSPDEDVALVRLSRPLAGHVFDVAPAAPPVGTEVVAIGYPLSGAISLSGPGVVSALDETVEYRGNLVVNGLMRTTVPTNRGNSGGPVLDRTGQVVGLVSGGWGATGRLDPETGGVEIDDVDGVKYAVPASVLSARLRAWRDAPDSVDAAVCDHEESEDGSAGDVVTTTVDHPEAAAVVAVFTDYAVGINEADYERAHAQLSTEHADRIPFEDFVLQQRSSILHDVVVAGVEQEGEQLRARVHFTSTQLPEDGPEGLTCAFWTLDWRLVRGGEHGWLIDGAGPVPGQPRYQACAG